MKIYYRISQSTQGNYNKLCLQLYTGVHYMDCVGMITFQSNVNDSKSEWYGKRFEVETDKLDKLVAFTKIIKKIENGVQYWFAQPSEIISFLDSIGAKEVNYFLGQLVLTSDEGKMMFAIYSDDTLYKFIIANEVKEAVRKANKLNLKNWTIKMDKSYQITF